jgi:hypothetical protein
LPALVASQPTALAPGWYKSSVPSSYEDAEVKVVWENSYIYPYPGQFPLYWYVEVVYTNKGNKTFNISCAGESEFSPVKEHMRGTANAGYVVAEETFCERNPNSIIILEPGEAFYDWATFRNVPWPGSEVRLEWEPYGFSQWVNPWQSPFSARPPLVCPPTLVTLGTCETVSRKPEGTAPNLVVLVHGCCTDASDVKKDWDSFGRLIAGAITTPREWEIVVLDWSPDTQKGLLPEVALKAYAAVFDQNGQPGQGKKLATAILGVKNRYKHVHLIGHSAGSNLINVAANELIIDWLKIQNKEERPFIHLTFLDAYTPFSTDRLRYGFLGGNYPHYSEHYVDKKTGGLFPTDENLDYAFNFDITGWPGTLDETLKDFGHQWPIYWYKKSITAPEPEFKYLKYGFPLSREGGNGKFINYMGQLYPPPSSNPSDPNKGLVNLTIHPPGAGVPVITEVVFPSSIPADGKPVSGTVKFTAPLKGVNWAQFDVLGDTCNGCFNPFGFDPGVSNLPEGGKFNFQMFCTGPLNYWSMKLTLRDPSPRGNPYIFLIECKPSIAR